MRFHWTCNAMVLLVFLNLKLFFQNREITVQISQVRTHNDENSITNDVGLNGSWIGDYWIPPLTKSSNTTSQRFYSAQEMRNFFRNESILFVGDSTGRRAFTMLHYILNSTDDWDALVKFKLDHPKVIDVNRGNRRFENCTLYPHPFLQLCRTMPDNPHLRAGYGGFSCNSGMVKFFQEFDTSPYTIIVVTYGAWHQSRHCNDNADDRNFLLMPGHRQGADAMLQAMQAIQQPNLTIVWRSIPMPRQPSPEIVNQTREMNEYFLTRIRQHQVDFENRTGRPSSLTALDWGSIMEPRTIPAQDRIEGDMPFHFGFESRLVFLQMLLHHLITRRKPPKANRLETK